MFFLFELCHLVKFAMDSEIGVGFMDVLCTGFRFILLAYGGYWRIFVYTSLLVMITEFKGYGHSDKGVGGEWETSDRYEDSQSMSINFSFVFCG